MNTSFAPELASGYTSKSQIARILTESWTETQMYCPVCGCSTITKFPNNRAVADFFCPNCKNEFEQKSKNGTLGAKIPDGAYSTFIQRISSCNNPDFFIMSYSLDRMRVESLQYIPKFFFVPEIVEKRKPLSDNARRKGWVGCNILFDRIPIQGRIAVIENSVPVEKSVVLSKVAKAQQIRTDDLSARGWLMDVLSCVNAIDFDTFTLNMVYDFEKTLSERHPNNNNIRAKIRQQLQQLRDRGVIAFLGNGHYKKLLQ